MSIPRVLLNSGNFMPAIGLGTFQIHGSQDIYQVLDRALSVGYRSFDTAAVYCNESDIGQALPKLLPKYGLNRNDIHITTKLAPSQPPELVIRNLKRSLQKLNLSYLDLYLVHWPGKSSLAGVSPSEERAQIWSELVRARNEGLTKDIGVSNYTVQHLRDLLKHPSGIKPVVNQVEWHPYCWDEELHKFCTDNNIILQAYSPLGGSNNPELLGDPVINDIAKKLEKSPALILLKWCLQMKAIIIPKSKSIEHLKANITLNFDIPEVDMQAINAIKLTKEKKFAWDPKRQA